MVKSIKQKVYATVLILFAVAIYYLTNVKCPILEVTGIRCLGCGMTRAIISAIKFNFKAAFSYHYMFWSVPLIYLIFLFDGRIFKRKCLNVILYILLLSGFVINWIMHI
ncbi:MAG: DUF2752 domain-containing protein [Eubacteriales bacterium]|nr:DUF2752 domain-containing protein [Eubacteriales bacterium]